MKTKLLSTAATVLFLAACCPAKHPMDPVVLNVADKVFFDFDSAQLRPEGRAVLDQQAEWFAAHPEENLVVEGHTDVRGGEGYNQKLGAKRAKAARDYLVNRGVGRERIRTMSLGESRPDVVNARTDAEHQMNRRAVTVLN